MIVTLLRLDGCVNPRALVTSKIKYCDFGVAECITRVPNQHMGPELLGTFTISAWKYRNTKRFNSSIYCRMVPIPSQV